MFAFGIAGAVCSAVKAIGYAMQEKWGDVALEVAGAATGGFANKAIRAVYVAQRTLKAGSGGVRAAVRTNLRTERWARRGGEVVAGNAFNTVSGAAVTTGRVSEPLAPSGGYRSSGLSGYRMV